jgi:glycosyltransferase involved in cell wall biosynthesis
VEARRALGFVRPTLLAVGNMVPKKRHVLLVEALAQLEGVELAIVGDGPERPRIEALANRLGVADRLRLLGRMPQESLPEIYTAAELLVHPSSREGWPNVLLESMACGTPVVVTHFDGLADIVAASDAGRIVTEATPAALAEAIRDLLAAPPRREATRRYAEGFDWQATTDGQIELFRQICGTHGGAVASGAPAVPAKAG